MTSRDVNNDDASGDAPEDAAAAFNRQHHAVFLSLSVFVVVMAFLLVVVSADRVAFRGFENRPLPHSCTARMLLDIDCPGCGLTRGTILFANGRLMESIAMHRLAWVFALLIVTQIPYRIACLARGPSAQLGGRLPTILLWSLIVLLFGNWLLGFFIDG